MSRSEKRYTTITESHGGGCVGAPSNPVRLISISEKHLAVAAESVKHTAEAMRVARRISGDRNREYYQDGINWARELLKRIEETDGVVGTLKEIEEEQE